MGKDLLKYVLEKGVGELGPLNLSRCGLLLIDGDALMRFLWCQNHSVDWIHGGQFLHYSYNIVSFITLLTDIGFKIEILFSGMIEDFLMKVLETQEIQKRIQLEETLNDLSSMRHSSDHISPLAKHVLIDVLKKSHPEVHLSFSLYEAKYEIAKKSKANQLKGVSCAVLGEDSDYLIFPVTFIPFVSLKFCTDGSIDCTSHTQTTTAAAFGISINCLPYLAVLTGNDFISKTDIESLPFYMLQAHKNDKDLLLVVAKFLSENGIPEEDVLFPSHIQLETKLNLSTRLFDSIDRYNLSETTILNKESLGMAEQLKKFNLLEKYLRAELSPEILSVILKHQFIIPGTQISSPKELISHLRTLRNIFYSICTTLLTSQKGVIVKEYYLIESQLKYYQGEYLPITLNGRPFTDLWKSTENERKCLLFEIFHVDRKTLEMLSSAFKDKLWVSMIAVLKYILKTVSFSSYTVECFLVSLFLKSSIPIHKRTSELPKYIDRRFFEFTSTLQHTFLLFEQINLSLLRPYDHNTKDLYDGRLFHAVNYQAIRSKQSPRQFLRPPERELLEKLMGIIGVSSSMHSTAPFRHDPETSESIPHVTARSIWNSNNHKIDKKTTTETIQSEFLNQVFPEFTKEEWNMSISNPQQVPELSALLNDKQRSSNSNARAIEEFEKLKRYALEAGSTKTEIKVYEDFQIEAFQLIEKGQSVVVSSPTGSGKTEVAMKGILEILKKGEDKRVVYICPTKALVNQIFIEILTRFLDYQGKSALVGLITADFQINETARIIITVPQIIEKLLLDANEVEQLNLGCVILDEIHMIQEDNGPVWERILQLLPEGVTFIALSATIGNPDEFLGWLKSFHPNTHLVKPKDSGRKVPLDFYVFTKEKHLHLINPLAFADYEKRKEHFLDDHAREISELMIQLENDEKRGNVLDEYLECTRCYTFFDSALTLFDHLFLNGWTSDHMHFISTDMYVKMCRIFHSSKLFRQLEVLFREVPALKEHFPADYLPKEIPGDPIHICQESARHSTNSFQEDVEKKEEPYYKAGTYLRSIQERIKEFKKDEAQFLLPLHNLNRTERREVHKIVEYEDLHSTREFKGICYVYKNQDDNLRELQRKYEQTEAERKEEEKPEMKITELTKEEKLYQLTFEMLRKLEVYFAKYKDFKKADVIDSQMDINNEIKRIIHYSSKNMEDFSYVVDMIHSVELTGYEYHHFLEQFLLLISKNLEKFAPILDKFEETRLLSFGWGDIFYCIIESFMKLTEPVKEKIVLTVFHMMLKANAIPSESDFLDYLIHYFITKRDFAHLIKLLSHFLDPRTSSKICKQIIQSSLLFVLNFVQFIILQISSNPQDTAKIDNLELNCRYIFDEMWVSKVTEKKNYSLAPNEQKIMLELITLMKSRSMDSVLFRVKQIFPTLFQFPIDKELIYKKFTSLSIVEQRLIQHKLMSKIQKYSQTLGLCFIDEVIYTLKLMDFLPAIIFQHQRGKCIDLFNQIQCDLLGVEERRTVEKAILDYEKMEEPQLLEFHRKYEGGLKRGIGIHHAGMSKAWKFMVERLFRMRQIKLVVATATLAVGIHMPCRAAVFHEDSDHLNPSQFQQMYGRSGRRGYDNIGHVVFIGFQSARIKLLLTSKAASLVGQIDPQITTTSRLIQLYHEGRLFNKNYLPQTFNVLKKNLSNHGVYNPELENQIHKRVLLHLHLLRHYNVLTPNCKGPTILAYPLHLIDYLDPKNLFLLHLVSSSKWSKLENRSDYDLLEMLCFFSNTVKVAGNDTGGALRMDPSLVEEVNEYNRLIFHKVNEVMMVAEERMKYFATVTDVGGKLEKVNKAFEQFLRVANENTIFPVTPIPTKGVSSAVLALSGHSLVEMGNSISLLHWEESLHKYFGIHAKSFPFFLLRNEKQISDYIIRFYDGSSIKVVAEGAGIADVEVISNLREFYRFLRKFLHFVMFYEANMESTGGALLGLLSQVTQNFYYALNRVGQSKQLPNPKISNYMIPALKNQREGHWRGKRGRFDHPVRGRGTGRYGGQKNTRSYGPKYGQQNVHDEWADNTWDESQRNDNWNSQQAGNTKRPLPPQRDDEWGDHWNSSTTNQHNMRQQPLSYNQNDEWNDNTTTTQRYDPRHQQQQPYDEWGAPSSQRDDWSGNAPKQYSQRGTYQPRQQSTDEWGGGVTTTQYNNRIQQPSHNQRNQPQGRGGNRVDNSNWRVKDTKQTKQDDWGPTNAHQNTQSDGWDDWGGPTTAKQTLQDEWGGPSHVKQTPQDEWGRPSQASTKQNTQDEWGGPSNTKQNTQSDGWDDWGGPSNAKQNTEEEWGTTQGNTRQSDGWDEWGGPQQNAHRPQQAPKPRQTNQPSHPRPTNPDPRPSNRSRGANPKPQRHRGRGRF
eukprot:TRINITY_DN2556_c0_g1_i3.p1 TRINITY_DN2556_c0_g1~~TRINITY_DN2556_c0_g1_i3.p1  ORF type:complete len:2366 (+),score=523.77 TRINITY_DN2556_c0_g1_i3:3-7100(+)